MTLIYRFVLIPNTLIPNPSFVPFFIDVTNPNT